MPSWLKAYLTFLACLLSAVAVAFIGLALLAWLGHLGFAIWASVLLFIVMPIAFYKIS